MRFKFLLLIILLSSCKNTGETIVNKQQAIKREMEQVKASFYKRADNLESLKAADTNSAKRLEIAEALSAADKLRLVRLLKLQNEYDSLEVALKK